MAIGKNITILVNGYNLGCALQRFEPTAEVDVLDATVLCNDYRSYEQGFKSGMVTGSGVWDYNTGTVDKIHEVMSAAFDSGDDVSIIASFGDTDTESLALIFTATTPKYGVNVELGQLIMVDVELRAVNEIGFGLFAFGAQVDEGEVEGDSIDNTVDTENGGLLSVQVENDDATEVLVTLQHSVDDSIWVDLVDTGDLTGDFSGINVAVPAGTTIERYTRVVVTVTGGDTVLVTAAFARN